MQLTISNKHRHWAFPKSGDFNKYDVWHFINFYESEEWDPIIYLNVLIKHYS